MLKYGIYDFVICRSGTDMCFVLGSGGNVRIRNSTAYRALQRSTNSGAAAKHPEDSLAVVGQSGPSTTPAISGAGVVPHAPSSKAPRVVASDAKPAVPGLPWVDLTL